MASSSAQSSSSGGIGFAGLLTIAFVILKLTHVIGWSWLWVLAPVWIGAALVVLVLVLVVVVVAITGRSR